MGAHGARGPHRHLQATDLGRGGGQRQRASTKGAGPYAGGPKGGHPGAKGRRAIAKMFVKWKNKEKCRAILNATLVNKLDPQKNPKFRLPALEGLRRWLEDRRRKGRGGYTWLDLQDAFGSIRLPRQWPFVFIVQGRGGAGRRYRYLRLQFGWAYSPAICQTLVAALVRGALRTGRVKGWAYIDDVLLASRSERRLKRAVRRVCAALQGAGFIMGAKSEKEPAKEMRFIGKTINTRTATMSNSPGAVVGPFRAWIRGMGAGKLPAKSLWEGQMRDGGHFRRGHTSACSASRDFFRGQWPKEWRRCCCSRWCRSRRTCGAGGGEGRRACAVCGRSRRGNAVQGRGSGQSGHVPQQAVP